MIFIILTQYVINCLPCKQWTFKLEMGWIHYTSHIIHLVGVEWITPSLTHLWYFSKLMIQKVMTDLPHYGAWEWLCIKQLYIYIYIKSAFTLLCMVWRQCYLTARCQTSVQCSSSSVALTGHNQSSTTQSDWPLHST